MKDLDALWQAALAETQPKRDYAHGLTYAEWATCNGVSPAASRCQCAALEKTGFLTMTQGRIFSHGWKQAKLYRLSDAKAWKAMLPAVTRKLEAR